MATTHSQDDGLLRVAKSSRVSSNEQTQGYGLDTQDVAMSRALDNIEEEFVVVAEFTEEGVTGTKFPREALMKILNLARRDKIDALVVKDVSRIGRLAGPTFGFIWLLNTRFNVDIITEDGRFNVHRKTDLIQMFFDSLNAEVKNRFRTSYVMNSQIEGFRQGEFHIAGRKARFGYRKTIDESADEEVRPDSIDQDDPIQEGEDFEKDEDEADVAKRMFQITMEVGPIRNLFTRIKEKLTDEFKEEELPDDGVRFNELLRDPMYKGKPSWTIDLSSDETKTATVDRPDLAIVDDETFDKVGDILDTRYAKFYNNDKFGREQSDDQVPLQQITSMVGLSRLVAFDDVVRIHCPDCGEEMQDNGKWRATTDIRPSNMTDLPEEPILKRYTCPNGDCERSEKRFPNRFEGYMLFNTDIPLDNLAAQV